MQRNTVARALALIVLCAMVPLRASAEEDSRQSASRPKPARADVRARELGHVEWRRDFDAALNAAGSSGRPVLILFQEIPGCQTCVQYGSVVLSHPLIVEAIESEFVPLAIYNNRPGRDATVLARYKEAAWNNPVVRFVDASGRDVVARLADDYSADGLVRSMVAAMKKSGRPVPVYLRLLAEEQGAHARGVESVVFAMHCFWEGENLLGAIPGVVRTAAGFLHDREVVEVDFDRDRIRLVELAENAKRLRCADRIYARNAEQARQLDRFEAVEVSAQAIRPDREPKYFLGKTPYRSVPMTALQACRVNAAIAGGADANEFLSPRQRRLLTAIRAAPDRPWPNLIGVDDLAEAWGRIERVAGP